MASIKAKYDGEFRTSQKVGNTVAANASIGQIFNTGTWHDHASPIGGTISSLFANGQQALSGAVICTVNPTVTTAIQSV